MVDLNAQYDSIKSEIDGAISGVIHDGAFVGGKYVEQFEKNFAQYCEVKHAIGLNSGTDALYLALWALGIKEGDEVITTPFSFFATAEVVARLGATPVFVDIDPNSFNIDPELIESKITKNTKAIIPVHLYGKPAQMDKIMELAKKYNLYVIEDACQAIGAKYQGKRVGGIGDIGCFSFYPSKNLGAYGDGGMLTTNNSQIAEKIKLLHNHGAKIKYHHTHIGVSSRLDGIQAAILDVKLKYIEEWNNKRFEVAKQYNDILKNIMGIKLSEFKLDDKNTHIYHQYTFKVTNGQRDELAKELNKHGISTMIYYPIPLHLLEAMNYLNYKEGSMVETEKAAAEVLSLPIYPELESSKIRFIADKIEQFFNLSC